ncbi:class I SAM-dependent methyltransferase [Candidatus Parcubacteria bacterium]|nr:class I SAM-dependent methyltransferase [Candidatus Parcubacteria bacterium]
MTRNTMCRDCGSKELVQFLDLSDQPPANAFIRPEQIGSEHFYPLKAYVCATCQLVQLVDIVDLNELFQNYVYLTAGAGPTTPAHFIDYAERVIARYALDENAFIVELGSNDGLLLGAFQKRGRKNILGIDPAENIARIANSRGIPTVAKPWSEDIAHEISGEHGQADVIIGNNVVAHINDHHDLVRGIKALLKPSGVFIFEAPYLIDMFENLSYDTIYHEHLSCLSLRPVKRMFESLGLEVFDMKVKSVQGVSMRVFVGWPGAHRISNRVEEFVNKEEGMNLNLVDSYHNLAKRVERRREKFVGLLASLKNKGKRIAGYGAPAKGNTMLNYAKIGPETLEYLTEDLPTKIGLLSPGVHIPVRSIADARNDPPDYFLMLAWNYAGAILEKEKAMRERGTKFIIPVGGYLKVI